MGIDLILKPASSDKNIQGSAILGNAVARRNQYNIECHSFRLFIRGWCQGSLINSRCFSVNTFEAKLISFKPGL